MPRHDAEILVRQESRFNRHQMRFISSESCQSSLIRYMY